MAKTLVMTFLNEDGKKSSIRLDNIKDSVTKEQAAGAMDAIIEKGIFKTTGGKLVSKDSAEIVDKSVPELKIK